MKEVKEEDINELLASHGEELNNEDLMTKEQQRAAEGEEENDITTTQLHLTCNILAETLRDFIVDNDSNCERSLELKNAIQNAIAAYKQLYKEKVLQAKQSSQRSLITLMYHLLPLLLPQS